MALKIVWSKESRESLVAIIGYLEENWSEKEIKKLASLLEEQLTLISIKPKTYKKSKRLLGTHECLLTKHNSLFYTYDKFNLFIVTIWDNRQSQDKLERLIK